ncbi:hypothetical protein IV203_009134 [Nitzschia inconspicua]|uniref:Uncharacterized protein n=1 Tax=Nitzschia inconspicua TaxID=303405 RepID=A0A9K3PB06_9STRA|nr:hypothetical protein IV203_011119 [Nitzschia inconspicua]KAG7353086.1 hypothetical protein IV203_009134 [Nitzschia inconspicua]
MNNIVLSSMLIVWWVHTAGAFQFAPITSLTRQQYLHSYSPPPIDVLPERCNGYPLTICSGQKSSNANIKDVCDDDDDDGLSKPRNSRIRRAFRKIRSRLRKPMLAVTPVVMAWSTFMTIAPQRANAGAPVMAMPKTKAQDPVQNAFDIHEQKMMKEAQAELSAFQAKAREVEREKGPEARQQFEKEYKEAQNEKAAAWTKGLVQLKRDLLDQGIDPDLDIEGRRQVILYEKGVDLGTVGGTAFYVEKTYEAKSPEKSFAFKKKANREMIKCMVQDLKNRDIDPLEYFSKNREKTQLILDLPAAKAQALAAQYQTNLDLYGQVSVPKDGEVSAKEMMAKKGKDKGSNSKDEQKRLKAEAKAKAAAEKAETKARAQQEKERIKEEKRAANEAAKKEQDAAKAASAAAIAAIPPSSGTEVGAAAPPSEGDEYYGGVELDDENDDGTGGGSAVAEKDSSSQTLKAAKSGGIKIIPASGAVVALAGGAYLVKTMRDRSAAEEAERQRQFKLLMGEVQKDVTKTEGGTSGNTLSDMMFDYENETEKDDAPELPSIDSAPKKKRRGLKSVFGKKKNDRETDITILVSDDAKAPEFAKTLAKILTFGAPGRFPDVSALPGDAPLAEFELEQASAVLAKAQDEAGITKEESAEIFANVVNCMLIDIVDLASTSLKEKDNKATVDALGIVIEFMDLAAQLYLSIADGVTIVPVTYGGDIGKGKLEQMYSAYAVSGMTDFASMDEKFEDKLILLRDVFQIPEAKADGLMTKAMQKNLMNMMKNPEQMEEMMKNMDLGDLAGMPGMDGEEPDQEQVKEMLLALKAMKESGSIPNSELENVKAQFKEAFGENIEELMKQADENKGELADADKEMLDLMKSILS